MDVVILITCANKRQAERIAKQLISQRLAACVNIVDKIKSIFWWQGRIDSADEALLIIKSKKSHLSKIITTVKSLHSYEIPEIIALPIVGGSRDYLNWINESIRSAH